MFISIYFFIYVRSVHVFIFLGLYDPNYIIT